jgi:hypothetical protein
MVGSILSSKVRGKAGPWLLMGTIIMVPLIVLVPLVPSYFYLIPLFFASGIVMVIISMEAAFFLQGAIFLSTFILLIGFRNLRNVTISEENNVGVQNGE